MIDIAIDCETIRQVPPGIEMRLIMGIEPDRRLKDPDKIAADCKAKKDRILDGAALSPLTGQICCVVCQEVDAAKGVKPYCSCGPDEKALLQGLCDYLAMYDLPLRLVTFNGRRFDLPYLATRCALHSIDSEWRWPISYSAHHVDLRDVLHEHSLDMWAERFFQQGKEHGGNEIQGLWDAGEADKVLAHCVEDVSTTADIWRRIRAVIDVRSK